MMVKWFLFVINELLERVHDDTLKTEKLSPLINRRKLPKNGFFTNLFATHDNQLGSQASLKSDIVCSVPSLENI